MDRLDEFGDRHAVRQTLPALKDPAGGRTGPRTIVLVDGDQPGDRATVPGDRERLSRRDAVKELSQVGFGFVSSDAVHRTLSQ